LLKKHGIELVDLNEGEGVTGDMFVDDVHLSAKGHAWVAHRLKTEFAEFSFPK